MKLDYDKNSVTFEEGDKNYDKYVPYMNKIISCLYTKTIIENKRQDANNRTYLGNVNFWLTYPDVENGDSNKQQLMFDKMPIHWDLDNIEKDIKSKEIEYELHVLKTKNTAY